MTLPKKTFTRDNVLPGAYLFRLPDWNFGYLVEVSIGEDSPGELFVRALNDGAVIRLSAISRNAFFEPVPSPS